MSTSETQTQKQIPPFANEESLLTRFMNRLATPLMTGLFVVSTVSGVALFFHWLPVAFHTMHVWLSMVLLIPFVFHVWRNWRSLVGYARRGTLVIPLVLSLVVAVPFAVSGLSGGGRGGNPGFRMIALMTQARLADLAPVLKTTPGALLAALKQRGYEAQSTDETLDAIATASGKSASELLLVVAPTR
jgi:hypothetical protein